MALASVPTTSRPAFCWLGWVGGVAVLLCLASIVVLTLLVPGPDSYPADGGFLPITPSGAK